MSKKDFIALADAIKNHNEYASLRYETPFTNDQIRRLADFCKANNSAFMRDRWLDYIAGKCGKNGGAIK